MAMNPMQKKARTSFLTGVLVTLIITGLIIGVLLFLLKSMKDEQDAAQAALARVYVLNQDVRSGQALTEDMFTLMSVDRNTIPSNATSVADVISGWYLQTVEGTMLNTDEDGLYYIDSNNQTVRVYTDSSTGNYYTEDRNGNRQSIELNNVPVLAKVDMNANTVITPELVVQSDAVVTDDVRVQEYNMVVLPVSLETGDYVDIRLMAPNGQDFIVISKKEVEIPLNSDRTYIADTIRLSLREDEILTMSSAIVEAYGIQGAKLYATKYKEAGMQDAAVPTYRPNAAVTTLLGIDSSGNITNPNVVEEAKNELRRRYQAPATTARNEYLQSAINGDPSYNANVQTGLDESSTNAQSARRNYIESLDAVVE